MTAGMDTTMRLTQGFSRACQQKPHATALVCGEVRRNWAEFADRVARLAAVLRGLGVQAGDRVSILADSSAEYVETYFGVLWAGGILAPVNTRHARPEMVDMLADCAPKVLIADPGHLDEARAIAATQSPAPALIVTGDQPQDGCVAYEAAVAGVEPAAESSRGGDDVACLFYTGGTTGRAKGVMLSHANLAINALNIAGPLGLSDETVHLHCGPLFHLGAGARVFATTHFCATHVVLPRFDPRAVLHAIERERVTIATFVPTMLGTLLAVPDLAGHDLSSLRTVSYGAAPMPAALQESLGRTLPSCGLVQSYGMTETSPVVTMLSPRFHDPALGKNRSAGRAVVGVDLRIGDAEGHTVASGTVGEILVGGPTIMRGYWNQPELTARAIREGWMHTGDGGFLDEDGFLTVVDRLKDMIVSGGENVYSAEVENALYSHPAVEECAVFGIPHEVWGEAVHAVVLPRAGYSVTEVALIAHCRTLIAGYKCPKSITVSATPLPRSGAGKILKAPLRDSWRNG